MWIAHYIGTSISVVFVQVEDRVMVWAKTDQRWSSPNRNVCTNFVLLAYKPNDEEISTSRLLDRGPISKWTNVSRKLDRDPYCCSSGGANAVYDAVGGALTISPSHRKVFKALAKKPKSSDGTTNGDTLSHAVALARSDPPRLDGKEMPRVAFLRRVQ